MNDFERDIKKAQLDRINAIQKSFESDNDIEKGQKANIGEIRVWGGKRYKKQANGKWMEVSHLGRTNKEHTELADRHKLDKEEGEKEYNEVKRRGAQGLEHDERKWGSQLSDKEYDESELSGEDIPKNILNKYEYLKGELTKIKQEISIALKENKDRKVISELNRMNTSIANKMTTIEQKYPHIKK